MESRMPNPGAVLPDAQAALLAFAEAAGAGGLAQSIKDLVHLRASQINGCSVCAHLHATEMKSRGNSDDRIYAVAAWRDAPFFTEQERAALDLTEHATRLADRSDPVPAEVFDAAAKQFGESELASLVLHIALINAFNRISVTTGAVAGAWR